MEFQVNTNNVILSQIDQVESGEYNVTECNFTFSSEFDGLTKKAVFTGEDGIAYLQTIVNNKCSIPSEILATSQVVQIGVYAYAVENEELILRYSPEPTDFFIHEGSYKEAQNSTPPTPSEIEQLQSQITTNANNIEELQGTKADKSEIPSKTSQLINDSDFVSDSDYVHTDNNFTDNDKGQITTNKNDISTINGNIQNINTSINTINQNIDDLEQDLTNYSLITETGSQINLNINSSNFQMTAILKDKNGNVIHTSNVIDLPLETMVVGASYDNVTKEVVLTLQNGTTLRFSVADLVEGLVSTDQLTQILSNYYNKTEVNNLLANHYTKSETDTLLNEKANQSSLDTTNQNVTNLTGRVSTNEEDIAEIKTEQTTQDTEIEALQTKVEELETDNENLRKALPQIKGQGTDFTLNNTSENKFIEFGLNGNTEQEQLSGKNLFDRDAKDRGWQLTKENYQNGIKLISTNNSGVCYILYEFPFNYNEIKDIYLNFQKTGNGFVNIYFKDIDNNNTKSLSNQQNSFALTNIPATTTKVVLYFYGSTANTGDVTIFDNIQLELGSTATSFEPYCGGIPSPNPDYPQQIKNVTGNANVKIQNKNLFDKNNFEYVNGKRLNDNGEVVSDANSSYSITLFEVKPNTAYTIQGTQSEPTKATRINYYDINKNFLNRSTNYQVDTYTFTTPQNCYYIGLQLRNSEYIDVNIIQLEQGSTATSYVPHQEQNYPFTFAEGQFLADNEKLQDNGMLKKWKQVTFSGTTITLEDAKSNGAYFCNKKVAGNLVGQTLTFDEEVTNAVIQYELAEPDTIQYNSTQQAQYNAIKEAISYYEQTNISGSSDELSPIITASAVGDLNLILDTMQSKIDLLEG